MAREYPRFLLSNPTNTKSKGPFVVHTIPPQFICRVIQENRNKIPESSSSGSNLELLKIFCDNADSEEVTAVMNEMRIWLSYQKQA